MKQAYCFVSISPVRAENRDPAEIVTQLLFGELVSVEEINEPWAKISTYFDNYQGWVDIKHLHFLSEKETKRWLDGLTLHYPLLTYIETPWGKQRIVRGAYLPEANEGKFNIGKDHYYIEINEEEQLPKSIWETALSYLNTPYLWGGKTPFGIDCSGFTQMVFRFFGINLPRDASQQVEHGREIPFEEIQEGDLAFFVNRDGKVIHVGILDGKGKIIHASGHVRIDEFTREGIVHCESKNQTHSLSTIKRM